METVKYKILHPLIAYCCLSLFGHLAVTTNAHANAAERFWKSNKWEIMKYNHDRKCIAKQTGKSSTKLLLGRLGSDNRLEVKSNRIVHSATRQALVRLIIDHKDVHVSAKITSNGRQATVTFDPISNGVLDWISIGRQLTIEVPDERPISIKLSGSKRAISYLERCSQTEFATAAVKLNSNVQKTNKSFPPICRSVGATIFRLNGKDTTKAQMSGFTTLADIKAACKQGTIHQGTMSFDQCMTDLKAQKLLHQKFQAAANCLSGEVELSGQTFLLPIHKSCASGGIHAAEVFKLLCPNSADAFLKKSPNQVRHSMKNNQCIDEYNNLNVTSEVGSVLDWINHWKQNRYEMQRLLKKYGVYKGTIDGQFGKNSRKALCEVMKSYIAIGGIGADWGEQTVSDVPKFVDWLINAVEAVETGGEFPD